MRWLLVLLLVAACGPSTPPAQPAGGSGSGNAKIEEPLPPLPADCPATWADALGPCDPATATSQCAYREGTAYCGVAPVCSGVPPDPEAPQGPTSWIRSERPPDVRADGCPGVEPTGACWSDGKVCSYGDCCFRELTCRDGGWTMTGGGCPP